MYSQVGKAKGVLKNFLIEPFVAHTQVSVGLAVHSSVQYISQSLVHSLSVSATSSALSTSLPLQEQEFYVCIYATREGDYVLFHHEGGVAVGDVDAKAQKLLVAVADKLSVDTTKAQLLTHVPEDKQE